MLGRTAVARAACVAVACAVGFLAAPAFANADDGGEAAGTAVAGRESARGADAAPARCIPLFGTAPQIGAASLGGPYPSARASKSAVETFPAEAHTTPSASGNSIQAANPRSAAQIEELLQYPELPAGCESVALACVLRSMGFDASGTEIVDEYLAIDLTYSDFVTSFAGDPYWGGGTLPPAIVAAANSYLSDQGDAALGLAARDITGATFEELLSYVVEGYPVLVWTTMYGDEPAFTGEEIDGWSWYINEHCVVLYGVEGSQVYVSDPLEGLVSRDADAFAYLYDACGSMAVVIE